MFLNHAEKGYGNVIGLDPSPTCVQAAQKSYGIPVVIGAESEIAEVMAAERSFDCAILSGVLEHIRDVEQALLQSRQPYLHLLTTSRLPQANIRAFVDSNPRYQGKQSNGIDIIDPSDLRNRTEVILKSSRVFQPVIEKQIRDDLQLSNEIIQLYQV